MNRPHFSTPAIWTLPSPTLEAVLARGTLFGIGGNSASVNSGLPYDMALLICSAPGPPRPLPHLPGPGFSHLVTRYRERR